MEKDSKKVAIVSRSYRLVAPFSRMLVVLLGFESIWLQIFKIYSSFYEMGFTDIQPRHWQAKRITTQEMNIYCEKIFGELAELFTGKAAQKKFGG